MIILYFLIIPILYLPVKLVLYYLVFKFGKISYDGFSAAGFAYNSGKDIFYSTKDAWQKKYGYCHLYDVEAPLFNMILDTEPIRFNYNNKNWLITFWKGQYGITTGAEIGIYSTNEQKINKNTLYFPAEEDEMLDMSFILYRKKEEITRIKAEHWWLAIFKLGMYSRPKDLTMDLSMTFPNKEMLDAFINSFKKLKHSTKKYRIEDNTFYFTYKKPHTRKVWTRSWISDFIRQRYNKKNVSIYNKYLADVIDNNGIDDSKLDNKKLIMIKDMIPPIFKNVIKEKKENKIIEEIIEINKKTQDNVIFLNENIYSNLKRYKNE